MRLFPIGILLLMLLSGGFLSTAQTSFPVNGVADPRSGCYAFVNATLIRDPHTRLPNATLVIRDGLIVAVGKGLTPPHDAVIVDCSGRTIYPSFIDIYSDYGIPVKRTVGIGFFDYRAPVQTNSNTHGAYDLNQAIHPETGMPPGSLPPTPLGRRRWRSGLERVLTHLKDGIAARGTGVPSDPGR